MHWSKKKIKVILITLGIVSAISVGSAGVQEMEYKMAYETLAFETADGDLGLNEYVVITENTLFPLKTAQSSRIPRYTENILYLIREVPKNQGSWIVTNDPTKILGKTEVKFRCEGCIYFAEFINAGGQKFRKQIPKLDYEGMRLVKNFGHPVQTETVILGGWINKVLATPVFNNQIAIEANAAGTSFTTAMFIKQINNPILVVAVRKNDIASTATVTYNSVSMISQRGASSSGGNDRELEVFTLVNPTMGSSQNIVASFSASDWSGISAASYGNVLQSAPVNGINGTVTGTANCDSSLGVVSTVSSSSTDSVIVSVTQTIQDTRTMTEQGAIVKRSTLGPCTNCGGGYMGDLTVGSVGTYSLKWTNTDPGSECIQIIIELRDAQQPESQWWSF